jgi:hypothetical protein
VVGGGGSGVMLSLDELSRRAGAAASPRPGTPAPASPARPPATPPPASRPNR